MAEDRADAADPRPASREPGAPIGKDEIDPELVSLRRSGPKVGTITAAAVVLACIVLMVRLRHDFTFARAGDTPRPVSVADVIGGKVADESYVTVPAPLVRSAAIRARVSEANAGTRVVPVAGSNDKLWVAVPGDAWSPVSYEEVATGRLRSMADVRIAAAVAGYAAEHPTPRFVTGDELRRVRAASPGGGEVALVGGGTLAVRGDDEVEIVVPDPGRSMVIVAFTERLPDVAAWTKALAEAGVIAPGAAPTSTAEDTARWEVARPSAELGQALDIAALFGARVDPATARFRAPWSQLATSDDGVRGPAGTIPWRAIDVAAVWAPRPVPAGAKVILVDEKPGSYWYLPPVYIGLGLFAVLFTWALILAVRRQFLDQPKAVPAKP